MPTRKFENRNWPHQPRLPLGDGWYGLCTASGTDVVPSEDELREFCNLGYARNCKRLPDRRRFDAVRFCVARDREARITVSFVCERDYRPGAHGTLEYDFEAAEWSLLHPDPRMQAMANCYLDSYLLRRKP